MNNTMLCYGPELMGQTMGHYRW